MSSIIDEINSCSVIDEYFNNNNDNKETINDNEEELIEKDDIKINKYNKEDEDIVVGIDLGTTNSCISIWRKNNLEIIPDIFGNRTIPSVVAFTQKSKYIGREAKKQIEINPENTFYEVKRLIGRKYDDETVMNDMQFMTYEITKDEQCNVLLKSKLTTKKNIFTPEEISAMLLIELKHMAEDYLMKKVTKAVITVPAYFNDAQRQATKDAAKIAGLDCLRIINEPTAAALAYGLQKASVHKNKDMNVLVYDLGGGTLDCSLLNISNGVFQVLGSSGNTHLGGADFDNRLISYCMNDFKRKYNYDKLENLSSMSFQKLKQSCEEAKKRLSEVTKTTIAVKEFYEDKNLFMTITREMLDKICKDLFIMCLKSVDDVLKMCEMEKTMIDEIILVGGCTRMPTIRNNLKLYFNGKEPNSSINPDEVVSAGAAIQGYILSHDNDPFSENVTLLDIIPLSLGVETIGGVMNVLIPRNSVIPIKRKRKYTTDADFETSVNVKVYEGERKMTKDNFFVGEFELTGIESAPRGIAQIEITFTVDINGIINVTALDLKNTDNKRTISINSNKGRLSEEKINELVKEAQHAEVKDRIEREKKQLYYEIDDLCSNIKMNVNNEDFKLKDNDKIIVMDDITKIFEWLKEMPYLERQKNDYLKILDKLKKKYGTLILKVSNEQDSIKAVSDTSGKTEATSIFNNDDEDETIYEEIENEELGIKNIMDEETKKEIVRYRETLVNLCYSVFEIISDGNLKIDNDNITELKDYINDVLVWVCVKEKISIIEYQQKINEVNKICNDIVERYNDKIIYNPKVNTKRSELEELCYALLSSILSNILALHEEGINKIKNKVEETLEWLMNNDINKKRFELSNNDFIDISEEEYSERIDEINSLCTELYNSMVNYNINNEINIMSNEETNINEILSKFENTSMHGMSIKDLRDRL
ncbi:Hsp70 protein [Fadolivirus algeromassiliense]|jgi:molecular chaperone DnaK (HSP70)|uniref:Hsp70 protein n=1 Tax=Fadolivirus FV1/VV64 TaxID=3070911 RepID=A0A7D3UT48_9VIRU|nr:Hsp70 protein [Fadolivirus algeromassiliense]QKF94050.1 Hsp70 protein [Fadolivirus FV1/VV64]